ncbi:MAG: hypothetical protein ACOCUT_00420 [bacterium]
MDQEFVDKLREYLHNHKPKYHLVVMQPFGSSSRYNGEHHNLDYVVEIADEVLGEDYVLNAQCMFRSIADSLRVYPSAFVIPQGHGDINAISNLESHFGSALPNIPIFHAMKNTGDYCNEDGSLKNPYMKKEKDELVQSAYRTWLSDSVKSNPLDVSDL